MKGEEKRRSEIPFSTKKRRRGVEEMKQGGEKEKEEGLVEDME